MGAIIGGTLINSLGAFVPFDKGTVCAFLLCFVFFYAFYCYFIVILLLCMNDALFGIRNATVQLLHNDCCYFIVFEYDY